jgi:hypothetical protein
MEKKVNTVNFKSIEGIERQFDIEHATNLVAADAGRTWILTDTNWVIADGKLIRNTKKSE